MAIKVVKLNTARAKKTKGSSYKTQGPAPPGSGERFAAVEAAIAKRGGVKNPGAVAAAIGRKKYGKTKFQKMAAAGRKSK
jgi:hypothetical protein